ncbi:MAG: hypothetical protein RLY14_2078 [Planctomycetota bacterium]|jgi:hypothetical protein
MLTHRFGFHSRMGRCNRNQKGLANEEHATILRNRLWCQHDLDVDPVAGRTADLRHQGRGTKVRFV